MQRERWDWFDERRTRNTIVEMENIYVSAVPSALESYLVSGMGKSHNIDS